MKKTRLSFYYLISYLILTGIGLLFFPTQSLSLLGATGTYSDPFVRFVGSFMIALGTMVLQIYRYKVEELYTTTIAIRLFFIAVILWLYSLTSDPLFLMILGVVVFGVVLTLSGIYWDKAYRRNKK